jgi:MFS family permease
MSGVAVDTMSARDRTLSLGAIIAAAFSVGVAFGVGFPLTSLTLEAWGASKWLIGIAGAVPAVAMLLSMPLVPTMIARFGAVWTMTLGVILTGLGFIALGFVNDAITWIAVRFLMSMFIAGPWLAGETWINVVAKEETRGRVVALYTIAFFSGFALGPTIIAYFGVSGWAPFLFGAAGTVLACIPVVFARHLAPDLSMTDSHSPFTALKLAPAAMMASFMSGCAETSYLSLLPNVGLAAGLEEARAAGLLSLLLIGGIALQFPLGWISDRLPRFNVILALSLIFMVLSLTVPYLIAERWAITGVMVLLGCVILGFYTVGLVLLGEQVKAADLAAANAGFIVAYQIGSIVGPLVAGLAMSMSPVSGFIATVVGLMLISTAVMIWLRRRYG